MQCCVKRYGFSNLLTAQVGGAVSCEYTLPYKHLQLI